jgi:hypothetical protein
MRKLEFIIITVVFFHVSALAHYLVSNISKRKIVNGLIGLTAGLSTAVISRSIFDHYPVSGEYRTWLGFTLGAAAFLGLLVFIYSWVSGELEGEGFGYKAFVFTVASTGFLIVVWFVSLVVFLARKNFWLVAISLVVLGSFGSILFQMKQRGLSKRSMKFQVDYFLVAASFSTILLFLIPNTFQRYRNLTFGWAGLMLFLIAGLAVMRRTYRNRVWKYEPYRSVHEFDSLESRAHVAELAPYSKIAGIRLAILSIMALPVVFTAGPVGRATVSIALVVYMGLEGLVIYSQLRIIAKGMNLLRNISL